MKKINGDVLLGFSDLFGAGPSVSMTRGLVLPKDKPVIPPKGPGGRPPGPPPRTGPKTVSTKPKIPYGSIPQKGKATVTEHAKIMKQAQSTLNKAVRALTGKKGTKAIATRQRGIAAAAISAAAAPSRGPVRGPVRGPAGGPKGAGAGKGRVVVGTYEELLALGAKPQRKLSAKSVALLKKRADVDKQIRDLDAKLKAKAQILKPQLKKLAGALVRQKKVSLALRTPGKSAVGFLSHDLIGTDDDSGLPPEEDYGAGATDSLTDMSADAGLDASAMEFTDADIVDLLDSGNLPPTKDLGPEVFIEDYKKVYGILYKGEKGRPNGYVLSYGLATRATDDPKTDPDSVKIDGTNHYGFVWGVYDLLGPEKGIRFGSNLTPDKWNHVHGSYHLGWTPEWREVVDESFVLEKTPNMKAGEDTRGAYGHPSPGVRIAPGSRIGANYGPLIGNPAYPDFKGMRVDSKGNMFWLPQEAPEWLLFPIRQAMAATKLAEEKARKATEEADRLRDQKDQKERDRERLDSELEADKTVQEARGETAKAESTKATAEAESLKTAGELQKLQLEQQRAQFEMMQQQMAAQQAMPYGYPEDAYPAAYPAYPEDEYEPEQPAYEDGMAVPGADIMQDADGAGYGQFESDEDL